MAKETIITCDCCGRNLKSVNTIHYSGRGSLSFEWSAGGNGGGCGDKIKFNDLCVSCSQELGAVLGSMIARSK